MAKLRKSRLKKLICSTCRGNGYVKIVNDEDREAYVHQCWDCDSEGEFYVYKPKVSQYDVVDNDNRNTDKFLLNPILSSLINERKQ